MFPSGFDGVMGVTPDGCRIRGPCGRGGRPRANEGNRGRLPVPCAGGSVVTSMACASKSRTKAGARWHQRWGKQGPTFLVLDLLESARPWLRTFTSVNNSEHRPWSTAPGYCHFSVDPSVNSANRSSSSKQSCSLTHVRAGTEIVVDSLCAVEGPRTFIYTVSHGYAKNPQPRWWRSPTNESGRPDFLDGRLSDQFGN